jgi:Uncharacterized conserved protein
LKTDIVKLPQGIKLETVVIPGGTFLMGSSEVTHEGPEHEVTVSSFLMGRYPVTQAQYQAIMGNNPSYFNGDNRPVENVSWHEAMEFCDRLSQKLDQHYTLPSEAQWEYACRAGTTTPFYFGDTLTTNIANYDGNYTYANGPKGIYREKTTEVGSFPPNGFGLYDMHGNVWEWCLDHFHDSYNGAPSDGSAWVTGRNSDLRILRGGSWYYDPSLCRCAFRLSRYPVTRGFSLGFRVVSVL